MLKQEEIYFSGLWDFVTAPFRFITTTVPKAVVTKSIPVAEKIAKVEREVLMFPIETITKPMAEKVVDIREFFSFEPSEQNLVRDAEAARLYTERLKAMELAREKAAAEQNEMIKKGAMALAAIVGGAFILKKLKKKG